MHLFCRGIALPKNLERSTFPSSMEGSSATIRLLETHKPLEFVQMDPLSKQIPYGWSLTHGYP